MKFMSKWFVMGAVGAFVLSGCLDSDMCGNDMVQIFKSPDGKAKAVIFRRSCGATTGYSTQVSVLGAGEPLPNEVGNLFRADYGEVWVKWLGSNRLKVAYERRINPSFQVQKLWPVTVAYEAR